ncbi:MAG TPA: LuxR C-terminal-related transcriptional regulator [Allosphingosinicella sp.]
MTAAFQQKDEDFDSGLFASIAHTPVATVITDARVPDYPIVAVNAAFLALTLYSEEELIGRNCRLLGGPGTEAEPRRILREAVHKRQPALAEILNYRKDGTPFRNTVMIAPVFGPDGEPRYFIGSQIALPEDQETAEPVRRQRARSLVDGLTVRQRQVLHEMMLGYRNKQIAPRLGINEKTVKMHRAALLQRLGAPTSADAIRIAVEAGI